MKRLDLKSLVLGVALGAAAIFTIGAASSTDRMPMEYRVVAGSVFDGDFQNKLNRASDEGWRLEESDGFTDRYAFAVMSRLKR